MRSRAGASPSSRQLVAPGLSGAPEDEVRAFFAQGMLLNLAAAMDLPQIAGYRGWALAHLRAQAEAGGYP